MSFLWACVLLAIASAIDIFVNVMLAQAILDAVAALLVNVAVFFLATADVRCTFRPVPLVSLTITGPPRGNRPLAQQAIVISIAVGCLGLAMVAASEFLDGNLASGALHVFTMILIAAIGVSIWRQSGDDEPTD